MTPNHVTGRWTTNSVAIISVSMAPRDPPTSQAAVSTRGWPGLVSQVRLLESSSETEMCAGVEWVLLSAPGTAEVVMAAGWGRGRGWAMVQLQRSQPVLRGALQRGWPYRVDPSWGKGIGLFFPPHKSVIPCRLLPGRGRTLGNSLGQRGLL